MKYLILLLLFASCNTTTEKSTDLKFSQYIGRIPAFGSAYKIKVDGIEYVVVKNGGEGIAIIKHERK